MTDNDMLQLPTETDVTLEELDLGQLRQERLDRNRAFLQTISPSVAARILPKEGQINQSTDVHPRETGAAICIQKNWRGYQGRKLYVNKLYEKFMEEEDKQQVKTRYQMEEGELLVENHKLEVLLDEGQTTRRNAERRYLSNIIIIQRAWRRYLERVRRDNLKVCSPSNVSDRNHSNSNQGKITKVSSAIIDNETVETEFISKWKADKSQDGEKLCQETEKELLSQDDSLFAFVNPLASPQDSIYKSTSEVSHKDTLVKHPNESEEDFFKRQRKHNYLTQAHDFFNQKKIGASALPLNMHMDKSETGKDVENPAELNATAETMSESETQSADCVQSNMCGCGENSNTDYGTDQNCHQTSANSSDSVISKDVPDSNEMDTNAETKGGQCKGSPDEEMSAFDVYNIETALPEIDWKSLEANLKAASEEAKQIQQARRNDREEIRKKLAMGGDDDYYDDNDDDDDIGYKKPNLQSRLHSGLQICFMNESPGDTDSEGLSPRQHDIHDNLKRMAKDSLVDSDNNLQSVADLNNPTSSSTMVTKVQSLDPSQLKDKTAGSEDFQTHQEKLQEEAKLALAQAGSMAHMQLEIEKQLQKKSPMAEMVGIPGLGERRRKKLGLRKLQEMNLTSIQVLYNDLQTQIESLNEELVHLLMERDELHMEQDSMLVDIEDLTRRAEELAERTYASKDSKNIVKGKVPSR